jgi:serine/threonine protein kinase
MLNVVLYLHDTKYTMHTDISIRNWFVKDNGALVLGDFGSAKVLGPFGYVKAGEP